MTPILTKFQALERHIASEKGDFGLFALLMREDAPDRWDLIGSAPWIGDDKRNVVNYFVNEIKARFGAQELMFLSRIVIADPQDPHVQAFNGLVSCP